MAEFVHLHLHSEYSLLDGACRIAEIPKKAKAEGHGAVAITDHGNLFGAVAFFDACKKEGVKPIIGCEMYVARGDRREKPASSTDVKYDHLVLLVKNETGYKNLIRLVSDGYLEGFFAKPRIDLSVLATHSEGLIALTGCLAGYIPRALLREDYAGALSYAVELERIMGKGNLYLELQRHGLPEDATVCRGLERLSQETGIPLVATNDVHYIEKSDAETQQVLMCIQTSTLLSEGRAKGFETDEFYYKSTAEMEALFSDCPQAVENTAKIAAQCDFAFDFSKTHLPAFDLPPGESAEKTLHRLAREGLARRMERGELDLEHHEADDYKNRMTYEMLIIDKMGYCDYYLIVRDFVQYAKSHGIPTGPGRGSGAGSLVAYLVGITEIDPLRYGLLFERFLNLQRISMPDFDIDFCYNRRDEVVRYVEEKYGKSRVTRIIAFGTLAARAAVRDVGRALGMPFEEVDRVAKLVPREPDITLRRAFEKVPELSLAYEKNERTKRLLRIAMAVEGMPRHITTHAAGIVITKEKVSSHVPLAVSGEVVLSQFGMEALEKLGLLKFDFLALRYLTVIAETERLVRQREPEFHVEKIPLDDAESYALLGRGDSEGVFQLESPGMKRLLMNMRPRCIEDIMIAIALHRPGPMDSIPKYLECRETPGKIHHEIEAVDEILADTSGCIVYQEQVMQIFRKVAGYSYGKADVVRKAIAKKHPEQLELEREGFLAGAARNKIPKDAAGRLFDEMARFADYAFNKSHAAAYSYLSYRTAYLKAHYRTAYFAALLTSVQGNADKMAEYISDCEKAGITVLPPDISVSESSFTFERSPSGSAIRYGLAGIKNVGEGLARAVCEERSKGGKFTSFRDFLTRMSGKGLGRTQLQSMIYAGAADCFGMRRSQLLEAAEPLLAEINDSMRRELDGQTGLLGGLRDLDASYRYADLPEVPRETLALREREATGLNFTVSLMEEYSAMLQHLKPMKISDVLQTWREEAIDSAESAGKDPHLKVSGVITSVIRRRTKRGEPAAFVRLQDGSGEIEALFFRKALADADYFLREGNAICLSGSVRAREEEAPKILAASASELVKNRDYITEELTQGMTIAAESRTPPPSERTLYLRVPDLAHPSYTRAAALVSLFGGPSPVVYFSEKKQKYYTSNVNVAASDFVLKEMIEILGRENVILR